MRTLLPLLVVSCLASAGTEPLRISVKPESVRLHPHEAWVTRTGRITIPSAGVHQIAIGHLPAGITLNDIRVKAKGPAGSMLGEIRLGEDSSRELDPPEMKQLATRLEGIQLRLQSLGLQDEAAEQSAKFLAAIQPQAPGADRQAANPGLIDLSRQLEARQFELLTQAAARKRDREIFESEKRSADREWNDLLARLGKDRKWAQLIMEITSPQAGDLEVELATRSTQAQWTPGYEIRVSPSGQVDWFLFATISQNTGEAWSGVRLELSNADPQENRMLKQFPNIAALSWKATEPAMRVAGGATVEVVASIASVDTTTTNSAVSVQGGSLRSSGALNLPGAIPAPRSQPLMEPGPSLLAEAKGLFSTFVLDGRKDVPSTAESRRFKVMSVQSKGTILASVAPRLAPEAFLVVRFVLPEGMPLFPGSRVIRVFDEQRLGEGPLVLPPAGNPMEFSLGLFHGIRSQLVQESLTTPFRKSRFTAVKQANRGVVTSGIREETETTGIERIWTLKEKFVISNDTSEPIDVEIRDRLLVSTHESVKVDFEESGEAQGVAKPEQKCRIWVRRIPPRATETLRTTTRVHAPKDGEIIGMKAVGLDSTEQ